MLLLAALIGVVATVGKVLVNKNESRVIILRFDMVYMTIFFATVSVRPTSFRNACLSDIEAYTAGVFKSVESITSS